MSNKALWKRVWEYVQVEQAQYEGGEMNASDYLEDILGDFETVPAGEIRRVIASARVLRWEVIRKRM